MKKFTPEQKVRYHEDRVKSNNSTTDQKAYSRNWLNGYNDEHARHNLNAAKNELKRNKAIFAEKEKEIKNAKSTDRIILGGYIKGATARLNKK